jgi:hypothetical protein
MPGQKFASAQCDAGRQALRLHHPERRPSNCVLRRPDIGHRSSPHSAQRGVIATYRSESPLEKTRSRGVRRRRAGCPVREGPKDGLGTGVRTETLPSKDFRLNLRDPLREAATWCERQDPCRRVRRHVGRVADPHEHQFLTLLSQWGVLVTSIDSNYGNVPRAGGPLLDRLDAAHPLRRSPVRFGAPHIATCEQTGSRLIQSKEETRQSASRQRYTGNAC